MVLGNCNDWGDSRITSRGPTKSPRSAAKSERIHYFVKDRAAGFRCLNCNWAGQDMSQIKEEPCNIEDAEPGPELKQLDIDERHARKLQLQELQELEAEGKMLQELVNHHAELMALEDLEAQEASLLELLRSEEEADMLQAKIQSLAHEDPSCPVKQTWTPLIDGKVGKATLQQAEDVAKRALVFERSGTGTIAALP